MEKLLNVRQAAALLNVSQMTIRRWTNDGLLTCFRIGKKRERRFSEADLHAFLAGRTDPAARSRTSFATTCKGCWACCPANTLK